MLKGNSHKSKIDFISTSEGRALRPGTVQQDRGYDPHGGDTTNLFWRYEYHLNDHLGNLRVACRCAEKAQPKQNSRKDGYPPYIVQQLMYDTWGVKIPVFNPDRQKGSPEHRNKYNGKEYLSDLDWYEYGARMYDPTIGRFTTQDRFSEKFSYQSTYLYAGNNPVSFIDVNGDSLGNPISAFGLDFNFTLALTKGSAALSFRVAGLPVGLEVSDMDGEYDLIGIRDNQKSSSHIVNENGSRSYVERNFAEINLGVLGAGREQVKVGGKVVSDESYMGFNMLGKSQLKSKSASGPSVDIGVKAAFVLGIEFEASISKTVENIKPVSNPNYMDGFKPVTLSPKSGTSQSSTKYEQVGTLSETNSAKLRSYLKSL
jgi:RHS repeat-associated protein